MCVCVSTPQAMKTIHMKWSLNNQSNKSCCFSVCLYGTCYRYNHRYTTLNRDWKRVTHTKLHMRVSNFHTCSIPFLSLQRLDAQQTNEKCTTDSREAVADSTL